MTTVLISSGPVNYSFIRDHQQKGNKRLQEKEQDDCYNTMRSTRTNNTRLAVRIRHTTKGLQCRHPRATQKRKRSIFEIQNNHAFSRKQRQQTQGSYQSSEKDTKIATKLTAQPPQPNSCCTHRSPSLLPSWP